jgi:hypothetical protein
MKSCFTGEWKWKVVLPARHLPTSDSRPKNDFSRCLFFLAWPETKNLDISKNLVIFQIIDPKSQVLPNSAHNNSTAYTTQGHRSSINGSLKTLGEPGATQWNNLVKIQLYIHANGSAGTLLHSLQRNLILWIIYTQPNNTKQTTMFFAPW